MKNKPKVDNKWKKKFKDEFYEGDDYTSNRYSNLVGFIEYEILPDIITRTQQEILEWCLRRLDKLEYKVGDKEDKKLLKKIFKSDELPWHLKERNHAFEEMRQTIKKKVEEGK